MPKRKLRSCISKLVRCLTQFFPSYGICGCFRFFTSTQITMEKAICNTDYLFSFGVITDIQYADIPDGPNYSETRWRYYRNALSILQNAVEFWKSSCSKLTFVLQLGDIIDRHNAIYEITESGLESVLTEFRKLPCPTYHLWGNHEFYNYSRQQLEIGELYSFPGFEKSTYTTGYGEPAISALTGATSMRTESEVCTGNYFFAFSPHPNCLFISLDGYDVSLIGREKGNAKYVQALNMIKKFNVNEDLNSPVGLHGLKSRFVMFNGAFSEHQLKWLDKTLQKASENNLRVIILSHLPLHPYCCSVICLAWNYQQVLDILWKYKCVEACFYGHDHDGGYYRDKHGIHHRTFEGAIEAKPGLDCYATVHYTSTGLIIEGKGKIEQQFMPFRNN